MIRFRMYFDKEKACRWLNEMASDGWRTTGFGGGFWRFEPCDPGQYAYQMDFSDGFMHVSADYRALMEDLGLDIVGVWGPWVLLEGPMDADIPPLYTDSESGEQQARRMFVFFRTMALVMLLLCMFMAVMLYEAPPDPATMVGGEVTVMLAAIMTLVFLLQCRRLARRIDALRAERGAPAKTWRRLPALMLVGLAVMVAVTMTRPVLERVPGLRNTVCWIGIGLWVAGLLQYVMRKE